MIENAAMLAHRSAVLSLCEWGIVRQHRPDEVRERVTDAQAIARRVGRAFARLNHMTLLILGFFSLTDLIPPSSFAVCGIDFMFHMKWEAC